MNLEQMLNDIRAACVAANSSRKWGEWYQPPMLSTVSYWYDLPCRLADVLLAIPVGLKRTTAMALVAPTPSGEEVMWNRRKDDVTLQTPECISFIHSLLRV